ncbi:V-type ATP synthase subunit I [Candidatus Uabimicrobium sp. HlEnr_7]|uniref:V-type ATP synthase subunit I n=1 Tax=Candidatus Uabimicrobium helgolandensis TaxID=3095367 RepID=UPI003557EA9D
MIVSMKRLLVLGTTKNRKAILEKLQEIGVVHVVSANVNETKSHLGVLEHQEQVTRAISILDSLSQEKENSESVPDHLVENIITWHNGVQKYKEESNDLTKRIESLSMWGEFSTDELQKLQEHGVYLQFIKITAKQISQLKAENIAYKKQIGKDIFAAIISHKDQYELPDCAQKIVIPKGTIELKKQQQVVQQKQQELNNKLQQATTYLSLLKKQQQNLENEQVFKTTEDQLLCEQDVFALKGFIPEQQIEALQKEMQGISAALVIEEIDEEDEPPTLIQNPKWVQSVVDLVKLYASPGYKEWDSSSAIYLAFTVFFAMIVGDAGYGCILLALMLGLSGKLKSSEAGQRIYRLMITLSVGCIIFGAISGNWFAIQMSADNPLKQFQILGTSDNEEQNLNNMMMLSVYVGAVHLSLARIIQIIRVFPSTLWINQVGWLIMMWGAIAKILWKNDAGLSALAFGAVLAVLFASKHRNIFMRFALGLLDLLGITQNFADILSYLRLFALGLASTVMAKIFNDLGMQVREVSPSIGPILMVLVIFMGHTINIVLAIMGGFIHGLRLNFLEFYRYCFEGTGYDYKPFAKKAQV